MGVVLVEGSGVGDRDGCCEFGVGAATLRFEFADVFVQCVVGEVHQLGNHRLEHVLNCIEHTYDCQAVDQS